MNRDVIVTAEARDDLIKQYGYFFDEESQSLADRFWIAANATFEVLARRPMGQRLSFDKVGLQGLRLWRVDGFDTQLIFYLATNDAVEIIRVLHASQDWMTVLQRQFKV